MMADSRTLKLEILAETKQFVKDMDKSGKEVDSFGERATKMGKVAAAAFAAAAAAAAAYAVKLAVDGVKAAIEDEAAQLRLANALRNVTDATDAQIAAVEDQITKMSLAFGIADDQLRPAFQRLATATGNLGEAQEGLGLALDISAATGKSVEAVSNALAKAYEGNTGALSRLGVGLSAAEIKTLGLDGTMQQLASTFGGAATVQANTLEGQMQRLKILFTETQESVGAGLLPAVKQFIDYVTNRLIPMLIDAKNKAIDPIKKAFADNREEMQALWQFTKTYLVPLFETVLVGAIKNVGSAVATVTNIIGAVIRGIESLINKAIDMINGLITRYNSLPDWLQPSGDIRTISRVDFTPNSDRRVGGVELPFGGASVVPSTGGGAATGAVVSGGGTVASAATTTAAVAASPAAVGVTGFNAGSFRRAEAASMVNVYVSAPSAIDKEGFTRAVVDALNESQNRLGGGAGQFNDLPV